MRIEYLKYLLDVAEHQSIAKAARINFISSQGMSRVIHELEKELGHTLVERYPNKLKLTETCKQLLPYIESIQREYGKLSEAITSIDLQNETQQTFSLKLLSQRIATIGILPQSVFFPSGDKKVKIFYREMNNDTIFSTIIENAKRREPDDIPEIGLVTFYDPKNSPLVTGAAERAIQYVPYLKTYDLAIVSSQSKLAHKKELTKKDMLQYPLISSNSQLYNAVCQRFGENAVSIATGSIDFRIAMVEQDEGLSFIPAILLLSPFLTFHDVAAIPFEDTYSVECGFIGTSEALSSEPFRQFVKALNKHYEPHVESGLFTLYEMSESLGWKTVD